MVKLALKPGILSVASQLLAEGTWWAGFCVRFFLGMVQKIGGWTRLTSTPLIGTCRGLHGWSDLVGNGYLAAGTEQRLSLFEGGMLYDITPLRATTNPSPAFTTIATESLVSVNDATNGATAGDWVYLPIPVSIGGLILQGFYQVQSITDANNYVIEAQAPAAASAGPGGAVPEFTTENTSGNVEVTLDNHGLVAGSLFGVQVAVTVGGLTIAAGTYTVLASPAPTTNAFYIAPGGTATSGASAFENGGDAQIQYLLPTGLAVNTALTGYGIGNYGAGDYGLSSGGSATAALRQWSLDHWGEALLASPTNGAIYVWTPPITTAPVPIVPQAITQAINNATLVATAPSISNSIFVIAQLEILVSLGSETGGTQYPNLIRWSDSGDYTDFTPSATNQAGSFQIPSGSYNVAGLAVGLGALVWTDLDCWSMVYDGLPFVFAINRVATQCAPMSMRCPNVLANAIMWPAIRGFFRYDGSGVNPFPCPVWDFMFSNIDYSQLGQVFSAVNTPFNEISWFFPFSTSSSYYSAETPYGYVKFNAQDGVWDYGVSPQLQRTAWTGNRGNPSGPCEFPVGTDLNGLIQEHEVSTDADGQPLIWEITSGYTDLEQGKDYNFADWFLPDVVASPSTAEIQLTVQAVDYSGDEQEPKTYGPYTFTPATEFLTLGVRGRQVAVTFGGTDLGSSVRLGAPRLRVSRDGQN
jgi:hypothetical protein